MKNVCKTFLKKWVGELKNDAVPADIRNSDPLFLKLYTRCKPFTMTSTERMYALYKSVEYIVKQGIAGDLVECGVWKGGSTMLMALTLQQLGERNRKVYLYDTFSGMVEPTHEDFNLHTHQKEALQKWRTLQKKDHNDWCYATREEVRNNISSTGYPETDVLFIKGKVEDTIPQTIHDKIALLRLDTDWYDSTKHELKYLFPILSQYGILIIDDYGHWAGAKKAVDEFFKMHPIYLTRVDQSGRIGIKITSDETPKPQSS